MHAPRWLLGIIVIAVAVGCSPHKSKQRDVITEAYRLIDKQRSDDAIILLEEHMRSHPNDDLYSAKVTLASAYAHRAGFRIQKLVHVLDQMKQNPKNSGPDQIPTVPEGKNKTAHVFVMNAIRLSRQFAAHLGIFTAIPVIESAKLPYLLHAIKILAELEDSIRAEDALYRATLRIVYLKHLLTDTVIMDKAPIQTRQCFIDSVATTNNLVENGRLLQSILMDLLRANPRSEKQLLRSSDEIDNLILNLTSFSESMIVLDEGLQSTIIYWLEQNRLGKLIRCGGVRGT